MGANAPLLCGEQQLKCLGWFSFGGELAPPESVSVNTASAILLLGVLTIVAVVGAEQNMSQVSSSDKY